MTRTGKLFMHGRSQAVRLPKEFRFLGTEVLITKVGERLILEPATPVPRGPMPWALIDSIGDRDFMAGGREQPEMPPDPPSLDG